MTFEEYWDQCLILSREAGEKHATLYGFIQKNPMPLGELLIEHDRLVKEYDLVFRAWMDFSEEHKGVRTPD